MADKVIVLEWAWSLYNIK